MAVDRFDFGGLLFQFTYEYARIQRTLCTRAGLYSGQPRILTIIKANPGCTLSELSEMVGVGMPSLSVSVRNMKKSGLICTGDAPGQSRCLYLTPEGLKRANTFHEGIDQFLADSLEALGPEVSQNLSDSLTALVDYMQNRQK